MINRIDRTLIAADYGIAKTSAVKLASTKKGFDKIKNTLKGELKYINEKLSYYLEKGSALYLITTVNPGAPDPSANFSLYHGDTPKKVEIPATSIEKEIYADWQKKKEALTTVIKLLDSTNMPFELSDDEAVVKRNIKKYKTTIKADLNNVQTDLNILYDVIRKGRIVTPGQINPQTGQVATAAYASYVPVTGEEKNELLAMIENKEAKKQELANKLAFRNELNVNINKCLQTINYLRTNNLSVKKVDNTTLGALSNKIMRYFETVRDLWHNAN